MCGFAGFFDNRALLNSDIARQQVKAMTSAIQHRGPDAEGFAIETVVTGGAWAGLGHQRLSIIDLSPAGAQPMESHCGRYLIVFNGEIYNQNELRKDFGTESPPAWRGQSDTEVLLQLIALFGIEIALERIDGMFALALIDRQKRHLFLARDAFGEKPLVYGMWRGTFLFASELRCFTNWFDFAPSEDPLAHAALMQHSCIPAPRTIYKNIFKLPPANLIRITFEDLERKAIPAPRPWWDMVGAALKARKKSFTGDFSKATDKVEEVLLSSVSHRMASDVPLGALLSGGIDSSLTVSLMQKIATKPVRTFTIGLQEQGYDESSHAKAVSQHLGTEHETFMLTAQEVLDIIPNIASLYDEPFADSSQLPTYLVSKMASRHVTVALSGDGGDELFAGYNRHFRGPGVWQKFSRIPFSIRQILGSTLTSISPAKLTSFMRLAGAFSSNELSSGRAGEKLHKLAKLLNSKDFASFHKALLSTGNAAIVLNNSKTYLADHFADIRLTELPFDEMMMLSDTGNYLHNDVLTKVDRASMAASIETRTPFLNRKLFDLAWRLPMEFKASNNLGKLVLRNVLYQHIPKKLIDRPKSGFAIPVGRWLRGPLSEWAEALLSTEELARSDIFDIPAVRRLWQAHSQGYSDNEAQLWSILMYQEWKNNQEQ